MSQPGLDKASALRQDGLRRQRFGLAFIAFGGIGLIGGALSGRIALLATISALGFTAMGTFLTVSAWRRLRKH
jgi:hypothetical protein